MGPPNKPKNGKKPPANKPIIWAYCMQNGDLKVYRRKGSATTYFKQYSDLITESREFKTEDEFNVYKLNHESTKEVEKGLAADKLKSPTKGAYEMDAKTKSKIELATRQIEDRRPADAIQLLYKTTSDAYCAIVIIRFMTPQNVEDWRFKCEHVANAIKSHAEFWKIKNKLINNALCNMAYATKRDLTGDPDTPATKEWTSPRTNKTSFFPYYVAYTTIALPEKNKKDYTPGKEDAYLRETVNLLGKAIQAKMSQDTFAACFQTAIDNANIWAAITDPTNPLKNYRSFIKKAKIKVERIDNFNHFVIKDDAATMMEILYNSSRGKEPKYKIDDPDDDEEEEKEEEEEEEEENEPESNETKQSNELEEEAEDEENEENKTEEPNNDGNNEEEKAESEDLQEDLEDSDDDNRQEGMETRNKKRKTK